MSPNAEDGDEAKTGAFMRALQRIVSIEPREMRSIAWSWLYFFSLLASTFVLRPLRDSMGLNGGADKYPWLFTGTLVAMVVVSPPFALLVTKLPRKRFIPIVYRVSMACLLAFWLALTFLPASFNLAAAYTFFIWFSVFNLFVVSVFRGFMADIWHLDQAKRLFGFIGVGGTLGALAGSKMASLLAKPIGSVNLLFLSIVLLEVAVFSVRRLVVIHRIDAAPPGRDATPAAALSTSDMWRGLKLIINQSYLRWIASYTFMYGLVGTFLYYQQGKLVDLTIHDRDLRTQYFANIEFWVQLGTVLIQFFLTARLIRWFGITFALISQPAIAVFGWIVLSLAMVYGTWLGTHGFTLGQLAPELAVLAGVQILLRISNFATAQPAREALYTVVEREVKYKSKSFIDTFIYRLGDCLGAWAFMGIQVVGATLTAIAVLTIPIATVWVFVGRSLGRKQRELTDGAKSSASDADVALDPAETEASTP
ncbi:MAG TPA: Npt1/Npt2 family nucleotide transporter [Chthoniobacterales bacterium]|nr:Npt1/Npt2 family nucleotide transporter [Chthoniobacterales bacterium]